MINSYIIEPVQKVITYIKSIDIKNLNLAELKNIHFDLSSHWVQLVLLILIILVLAYIIDFLLSKSVLGQNYRLFVAPGVILHELSHAFFCLVTGAKIKNIALFDKEGGSVTHEPPKIAIIGPVLIAFAPLMLGIIAIFIISRWVGMNAEGDILSISSKNIIEILKNAFNAINFHGYLNLILIYLVFSIAVTMTPSFQDFRNAFFSAIILIAIIYFLVKVLSIKVDLSFIPFDKIIAVITAVIFLLIFALILSIIVFALSKLVKTKSPVAGYQLS